ncbi:MAG: IS1634 family transposase [Dehalococcoidia bacterium]
MFVKSGWRKYKGKIYYHYHVAESYRDNGRVRTRRLVNISSLPQHAIEAIRESLRAGKALIGVDKVKVRTGDALRGAGLLAIAKAWQQEGLHRVLAALTGAEQQSTLAMVAQRIIKPGSKLSLKEQFADTVLAQIFSRKRLDEDELYRVMDKLHEQFYSIQERLRARRQAAPVLCLYDITSTYFEGTKAEDGEYGYSRDKRWDRHQIVIGLVCDEEGVPLAIEVWPGNTADRSTVAERVTSLKKQFNIEKAIFVGDAGMYSEANIEKLEKNGFDYILATEWHTQRQQLEALKPCQLQLFDQQGVAEWNDDTARYVGCVSELKKARAARRREEGMQKARENLMTLASTSARGRYYSWVRLREKVNDVLEAAKVEGLWEVEIAFAPIEKGSPEEKRRLCLSFWPNDDAIARRAALEGKYVLRTSLTSAQYPPEEVDRQYRRLQLAERAFRHIKSYLKVRPIFHYLRRRIRAHVLICFLGFYLVKRMELGLRAAGETRDVEPLLQYWDKLCLVQHRVQVEEYVREDWQWSLGEIGQGIQAQIQALGWWQAIDAYRRRLGNTLTG